MKFTKKITLSALLLGAMLSAPKVEATLSTDEIAALGNLGARPDIVAALAGDAVAAGGVNEFSNLFGADHLVDSLNVLNATKGGVPAGDISTAADEIAAQKNAFRDSVGTATDNLTELNQDLAAIKGGDDLVTTRAALNATKGGAPADDLTAVAGEVDAIKDALAARVGAGSADLTTVSTDLNVTLGAQGLTTTVNAVPGQVVGDDLTAMVAQVKVLLAANDQLNGGGYGGGAAGAASQGLALATDPAAGVAEIMSFFLSYLTTA